MCSRYIAVIVFFDEVTNNPIACPSGRYMGCYSPKPEIPFEFLAIIYFAMCTVIWTLTHWPLGNLNEILRYVISQRISLIDGWGISCEIALIWISLDFADKQSPLVQVMVWYRQSTSHYLSQCWPSSMSPYGVTRPQWVIFKYQFFVQCPINPNHAWCYTWLYYPLLHSN